MRKSDQVTMIVDALVCFGYGLAVVLTLRGTHRSVAARITPSGLLSPRAGPIPAHASPPPGELA